MGFRDSFVAVKACGREAVLEALDAELGDAQTEFPERLHLAELPDGWIVVTGENSDAAFKPRLQALTKLGPAVAAGLSETVMYSEARGYQDGAEGWRLAWDCELEADEPETSGALPPAYAALLAKAQKQQAAERDGDDEVDHMFDLPLDLAKAVCGFKFGEDISEDQPFRELIFRRKPGFFARLFGRG